MTIHEALRTYLTEVPRVARDINWISRWDESKTMVQNCKDLKIPNFTTGRNLCYKFKLGFREGFHRIVRTNKESLVILKNNGLSEPEIARLLGVSSQRINEIINKK